MKLFWICLGGAAGTAARYLLTVFLADTLGKAFPYGTLSVNLIGSFLIGIINAVALNSQLVPDTVRLALTTGVMGGLTTYSTFNYETLEMLRRGDWRLALLNIGVTGFGCAGAGVLGLATGRRIAGA